LPLKAAGRGGAVVVLRGRRAGRMGKGGSVSDIADRDARTYEFWNVQISHDLKDFVPIH